MIDSDSSSKRPSDSLPTQPEFNLDVFESKAVVGGYANMPKLKVSEAVILQRIADEVRQARILDIGVGAGRTTPFLLELSPHYVGFDYAPEMVAACQARFPGVKIMQGDARHMEFLGSEEFGFVLFSWNGLDYVSHEDRLLVLAQVFGLLKPGGLYLFSSHNLNCPPRKPWDPRLHAWSWNPRSWARYAYYALRWTRQYWSRCHLQRQGPGHAILIDEVYDFRLVTYWVHPQEQIRQLEVEGFREVQCFDIDGAICAPDDPSLNRGTIYYLARKP